jgi:hypothetical protein
MKSVAIMTAIAFALLTLSGCGTTTECRLIETPYMETDNLATEWYDHAAKVCGFDLHKPGCRGRDADGFYNGDKKECQ